MLQDEDNLINTIGRERATMASPAMLVMPQDPSPAA